MFLLGVGDGIALEKTVVLVVVEYVAAVELVVPIMEAIYLTAGEGNLRGFLSIDPTSIRGVESVGMMVNLLAPHV